MLLTLHKLHEATPVIVNTDNVLVFTPIKLPGRNEYATLVTFIGNNLLEVVETVDEIVAIIDPDGERTTF